jgi:hypothetical protein
MKSGNIIMFVICAITLAIGTTIYFEASAFQKNAKITQGITANSGSTYFDVIYTSDDGVERTHRGTQGKNHKTHDGETKKVFYQSDNPGKSRIYDGVKGGKTVVIVAILLLLVNLVSIYQSKKRNKTESYYKTNGRKMEAEITKIDTDLSITIMKKHPWLIDCKWVDSMTGREYTHTIRYIWVDPETVLSGRKAIDVYVDREDPEKYFMDIAFLGEVAK